MIGRINLCGCSIIVGHRKYMVSNSFMLLGRKPGYCHHVSRWVFLGLCIFCTCHEYISYMVRN